MHKCLYTLPTQKSGTYTTLEQININANIHISQKIDIYTSIKITHEDFKPAH